MKEVRKKRQKRNSSSIRSVPVEKRSSPKRKLSRGSQMELPPLIKNSVIMTIDPSINHLGWSISEISSGDYSTERRWLARGSIFTRTSKKTRQSIITSVNGTPDGLSNEKKSWKIGEGYNSLVYHVIMELESIQNRHGVTFLIIEDYLLLEHKSSGAFSIPAFIGALKHHWYLKKSSETIMISAPAWKALLCGHAYADKSSICDAVKRNIGNEWFRNLVDMYTTSKIETERTPQDCIDATGIDLYVSRCIKNMNKYGNNLIEDILNEEDTDLRQQS